MLRAGPESRYNVVTGFGNPVRLFVLLLLAVALALVLIASQPPPPTTDFQI